MARRTRRRRRYSPRRWFRRGRRRDTRVPIIPTLALVSTVVTSCPSGRTILNDLTAGDWGGALYDAREKYAGIDSAGAFRPEWLIGTWGPVVVGALISKFAGRFVNPHISKIPIIGKYIRL